MVTVRLSGREKAILDQAASREGLALAAYIGRACVEAAQCRAVTVPAWRQQMLAELIRASGLVGKVGVNFNQAVAKLNATGQADPDLESSAAYCVRVVRRVDEAASLLIRRGVR